MQNTNLKVLKNDKVTTKREENTQKLKNKLLDYDFYLEKKQLKANKNIKKIGKNNEFKYREVEVKCNIKNMSLKAGYTLGKMCLLITFISCLLTFGGNISNFICNIPLLSTEKPQDFIFTWKIINSVKDINGESIRNVTITRLNILTAPIYIMFLMSMQSILYQISLNIYIIKSKFKAYYLYALVLQYSMLFYSVYSNYQFLSYYVNPDTFMEKLMCFIPSLLLDIASIFFLSLSMRMKTLNFDENLVKEEINNKNNKLLNNLVKFNNFKNKISTKNKAKIEQKKHNNLEQNNTKNSAKNSAKNSTKLVLKNPKKLNKIIENISTKISAKNSKYENFVPTGTTSHGHKKPVLNTVLNKGKFKAKNCTGNSTNKVKDKELKLVLKYIEKLKENSTKILKVKELKNSTKIDKNKWLEIKKILLKKNIIQINKNAPRTIYITYKENK